MAEGKSAGEEVVGFGKQGTGYLLVHRWRRSKLGGYVSVCGTAVTSSVDQRSYNDRCKRCFRTAPPPKEVT